jgi:hypothetical protein
MRGGLFRAQLGRMVRETVGAETFTRLEYGYSDGDAAEAIRIHVQHVFMPTCFGSATIGERYSKPNSGSMNV